MVVKNRCGWLLRNRYRLLLKTDMQVTRKTAVACGKNRFSWWLKLDPAADNINKEKAPKKKLNTAKRFFFFLTNLYYPALSSSYSYSLSSTQHVVDKILTKLTKQTKNGRRQRQCRRKIKWEILLWASQQKPFCPIESLVQFLKTRASRHK